MILRRAPLALGLAVAVLLGATGCGDETQAYCDALKKDQHLFSDSGSGLELIDNLPELERLARKAPSDLDDEWQTVIGALEALRDAVRAAGVSPDDFANGAPPASLSAADKAAVAAAANEIASPDVVDALNGIDQQAKDVCKIQLGL
ncbi:hypothetical protein [Marmoricola sp. RAF53]|uniref:hypothetical protein n=1 Tax=Marmoricola sp. RAF53 TaxID=3233059 RepID=UPI003F9D1E65